MCRVCKHNNMWKQIYIFRYYCQSSYFVFLLYLCVLVDAYIQPYRSIYMRMDWQDTQHLQEEGHPKYNKSKINLDDVIINYYVACIYMHCHLETKCMPQLIYSYESCSFGCYFKNRYCYFENNIKITITTKISTLFSK